MADCMARRIEDIEGAVAEEVVSAEVADLERVWLCEGYLSEFSTSVQGRQWESQGIKRG